MTWLVLRRTRESLLLIAALRTWFARPGTDAPAWYAAYADPVVGHALRLLHNNPAHPWTVAGLAAAAGVLPTGSSWSSRSLASTDGWRISSRARWVAWTTTPCSSVSSAWMR